jgi:hypothetical protein
METCNQNIPSEYGEAFCSTRQARNIFSWLILAMIVLQLAAFVLVNFVGVLDVLHKPAATAATSAVAVTQPTGSDAAKVWESLMRWSLPASKFLAFAFAAALALSLLLGLQLSLLGRLGGAASLVSAFFWSLVLLAALTPWEKIFPSSRICGALFNLGELTSYAQQVKCAWLGKSAPLWDQIVYYVRFIGYPLLTVLIWLLVGMKFCRACRAICPSEPAQPAA